MPRGFTFVANLKDYTFHRGRGNDRFDAYLLSVDFAENTADLVGKVQRDDAVLVADNGNVDAIRDLIDAFEVEAEALTPRIRAEEDAVGRRARPGDLSRGLVSDVAALVRRIRDASRAVATDQRARLALFLQQAMRPSYYVGMEDFTIAALTGLSLEPEYSELGAAFYDALAERAVDFAVRAEEGAFGATHGVAFAGVHAMDYDGARQAGRIAGDRGVRGVATGLVGALRDRNWVDYRIEDGDVVEFGRSVPRPYVRVAEIAAGLHRGYADATGRRLPFHALGAGSPILLPLLSLLGDGTTLTAADSTSPIVDGWSSPTLSMYVDDPAPLKLKTYKIAELWLAEGLAWSCACPYCRAFDQRRPPDVAGARAWWTAEGRPSLHAGATTSRHPLSTFLPLLGRHPDLEARNEAALARVGHNHWVIQRLERAARRNATPLSRRRDWVGAVVEAYEASRASGPWKAAVREAWRIADGAAEALEGTEPGTRLG